MIITAVKSQFEPASKCTRLNQLESINSPSLTLYLISLGWLASLSPLHCTSLSPLSIIDAASFVTLWDTCLVMAGWISPRFFPPEQNSVITGEASLELCDRGKAEDAAGLRQQVRKCLCCAIGKLCGWAPGTEFATHRLLGFSRDTQHDHTWVQPPVWTPLHSVKAKACAQGQMVLQFKSSRCTDPRTVCCSWDWTFGHFDIISQFTTAAWPCNLAEHSLLLCFMSQLKSVFMLCLHNSPASSSANKVPELCSAVMLLPKNCSFVVFW